jgi:hypothetical protein
VLLNITESLIETVYVNPHQARKAKRDSLAGGHQEIKARKPDPLPVVSIASPLLIRMHPLVRHDLARGRRHTSGRVGSDYQPKPAAVGSVFWPCGVINPVPGLFVGPAGNSVALAGTVWIAVVRIRLDHADSTAMGRPDDRLTMTCVCQRDRAEEREPRG